MGITNELQHSICKWKHNKLHSSGFASASTKNSYAPDLLLEPIHKQLYLDVDIQQKKLKATIVISVRAQQPARTLVLNGVGFQDVVVTTSGEEEKQWSYDGKQITIAWVKPWTTGEIRKISISYLVENPVDGLLFSSPNAEYAENEEFAATDHETERARYWLACVDYPTVRTTLEFFITAKKEYTILANGILQEEKISADGKSKTAYWKLDNICPSYLICFAVGKFVSVDHGNHNSIGFRYYAPDRHPAEDLMRSFGDTPDIMAWLEKRMGRPFPYPKYYQLVFPGQGGAMENISLTAWDTFFLCDERFGKEWLRETMLTNVHEMAHSYHGDLLTIRHFEHAWLKESWATYTEMCWLEDHRGIDEFSWEMLAARERYFGECEQYVRPIVCKKYDSSWDMFDRHLYPGGCWRIHMLRKIVGDEIFWKSVQDYVNTYSNRVVETDDFRRMLEKHSGLNLTKFFDQWLYSPGYPKLKATFDHKLEDQKVVITFEQTQEDSKNNVGLFEFDLEVEVVDIQGNVHSAVAKFNGNDRAVIHLANIKEKTAEIRIDPKMKVIFSLDMNPGEEILANNLKKGNLFDKYHAAVELIKIGTFSAFKSVKEAMAIEPFYGVRGFVGKLLSQSKSLYATEVLAGMIKAESHPTTMTELTNASIGIRHPDIESAALSILEKGDSITWRAVQFSLEILGHQRNPKHWNLLLEMSKQPSYHGFIKSGALKGLSYYRTNDAFDLLKELIPYGKEEFKVRQRIMVPFAELARMLEGPGSSARIVEAQEILESVLVGPYEESKDVVWMAIEALAHLGIKSSEQAMIDAKTRVRAQDHPAIDRLVSKLRESGEKASGQLKSELEELRERLKKIEHQVQEKENASTK